MYELFVQVLTIARGMWRFRWYTILVAYAVCMIGWVVVHQMPDRYVSHANVFLATQSVLEPLLEGLAVDTDAFEKVDMLSRSLTSRPNIRTIIRETDMNLRAETDSGIESLISKIIGNIDIERPPRSNIYTISYSDVDPVMAQRVVQILMDQLIERALGSSREDSAYAQKFLVKQISEYETRLTQAEERLAEFKKKNVGLMPGQGGGYYDRLQSALDNIEETKTQLRLAEHRHAELLKQLRGEKQTIGHTELDARIREKQEELNSLLLKYTDEHPDVAAAREVIAQLQEKKQSDIKSGQSAGVDGAGLNPVYQSIKIALSETEVQAATLRTELQGQQSEIAELEKLVDTIPEVEANLARLNRDYNVTKAQYEALLERLESARLSEGAEQSKDDIKFQIIEPPVMPSRPSEPNRIILITAVLFAGLGMGGGLAYVLNEIKPVFTTVEELGNAIGLPVLGVVSIKLSEQERHASRTNLIYLGGSIFALFMFYFIALVIA